MAKRRSKSKTRKVKRGKVSRKTMKRSSKRSRKSKGFQDLRHKNFIISASYGLAWFFKENQKGYKQQRVNLTLTKRRK